MSTYSLTKVHNVLKDTHFYTDGKHYLLLQFKTSDFSRLIKQIEKLSEPYLEIILDKDELSLIIEERVWNKSLAEQFVALNSIQNLSLITCEVQEDTVTGFLLAIVAILSPNNISVYVQGAFTTDHIFVESQDLDKALKLLEQLKG